MDPREQRHHEQQRMQDQMRHMQHMDHMGMGAGFMPGMDLAAMFGNVSDHFAVLSHFPLFFYLCCWCRLGRVSEQLILRSKIIRLFHI
jgi:hypothetical protein